MHPNFAGALLNSALYLLCVFVAGLVTGHPLAWKLAVAALGVTYAAHCFAFATVQMRSGVLSHCGNAVVAFSIILGIAAGLALLF